MFANSTEKDHWSVTSILLSGGACCPSIDLAKCYAIKGHRSKAELSKKQDLILPPKEYPPNWDSKAKIVKKIKDCFREQSGSMLRVHKTLPPRNISAGSSTNPYFVLGCEYARRACFDGLSNDQINCSQV